MKIATWNVNSLRVRLPHVLDWLASAQPDIVALQEIKLQDEHFPVEEIRAAGYHAVFSGQKTYNGVALLSRTPASDVMRDIPGLTDPQRRVLSATFGGISDGIRVVNVYIPNGESVGSEKYSYKMGWLDSLCVYLEHQMTLHPHLIVLGDFNIAPEDRDVHDPKVWEGQVMVSPGERHFFVRIQQLGLVDTFRCFDQPAAVFSWWDYRALGLQLNKGLRIDHILASPALIPQCVACTVDKAPRKRERPSDHAPVIAEFALVPISE